MTHIHYVAHTPLPKKGNDYDANWLTFERFFNANIPVCVGATGDPGTIVAGTPGAISYVTWTSPSTIYDSFNFTGQTDPTTIRIPVDGFYDFYLHWFVGDTISARTYELQLTMQTANTSNTGIGSPSWTTALTGPSRTFVNQHLDKRLDALYRSIELHANDLIRFGVQIYSADPNLTNTTVTHSEFKFAYPIPNKVVL